MRLKIRPEDVSTHEMSDWVAWLRAEAADETASDADETAGDGARPETVAPARPADEFSASVKPVANGEDKHADQEDTCRAVIGDELRIPIAWCEMGSCISHHTDPVALGEADIRIRALRAGWRLDRFGRLACVDCLQSNPWFRTAYPVVLWNRRAAVATATVMAADLRSDDTRAPATVPSPVISGSDDASGGLAAVPSPEVPTAEFLASPPADQRTSGRHRKQ